jgi:hypothetical protein
MEHAERLPCVSNDRHADAAAGTGRWQQNDSRPEHLHLTRKEHGVRLTTSRWRSPMSLMRAGDDLESTLR